MIKLERLPRVFPAPDLPRWRCLCEGCRSEVILSDWGNRITKERRCRSCALRGNLRGAARASSLQRSWTGHGRAYAKRIDWRVP